MLILMAISLLEGIVVTLLSRKKRIFGVAFLIVITFIHLTIINGTLPYWHDKATWYISSQSLQIETVHHLDNCSFPIFPVVSCRLIYNKLTVSLERITTRVTTQISGENLLTSISSPFKEILTVLCFVGICLAIATKRKQAIIMMLWLTIYAFLGIVTDDTNRLLLNTYIIFPLLYFVSMPFWLYKQFVYEKK
jgi:ABC-type multidrug transport system fused ATPase/permease subunit